MEKINNNMTAKTFFTPQKCNHTIDINMTEIMQHCDIYKLNYLSLASTKRRYEAFKQYQFFRFFNRVWPSIQALYPFIPNSIPELKFKCTSPYQPGKM